VKYASAEGMDLIIMATHGRTGLAHVVMGSIAEKVVRHSEVPVLTIKPLPLHPTWVKQQDVDEQLHLQS
jgi:nucleotide-binding universal stress UspA family protein